MTLHLNLQKKWFDKHLVDKTEDYRDITLHWVKRLMEEYTYTDWENVSNHLIDEIFELPFPVSYIETLITEGKLRFKTFDSATYSNGMKPVLELRRFKKEFLGISIGYGNTSDGAPEDKQVFIIACGKILKRQNC